MPKKGKKVDPKTMDRLTEQYTAETVGTYIDQAFGKVERVRNLRGEIFVDRGDHIVIDGRTAREILAEEYAEEYDRTDPGFEEGFDRFYNSKGKKLIHEKVAAAMMTGKRVDFFVPDPHTGRIPKEPTKLVGGEFVANPVRRPAQMTRWQKFWSKLGFYKDKVAEQSSYRRQKEAHKRVRFYNKVSRARLACVASQTDEISAAWKEQYPERKNLDMLNLPDRGPYKLGRSGMACYVNCLLARQKGKDGKPLYSNEQLFDMKNPAMRQARADAAEELYRRSMVGLNGDVDWLCRLQHDSRIELKRRLNEQGRMVNFSQSDVTDQKGYREFSMLSSTAFDLTQQVRGTQERLNELYPKEINGDEFQKFQTELGDLPTAIDMIHDSLIAQKRILSGEAPLDLPTAATKMQQIMAGQAVARHFSNQHLKQTVSATDFVANNALLKIYSINGQSFSLREGEKAPKIVQQINALAEEYVEDPEKFSAQIESGVLEERVELDKLGELDSKEPIEMNIRDVKSAEVFVNQRKMFAPGLEV